MSPLNHALTLVAEEAAEIIIACTKCQRFGIGNEYRGLLNIDRLNSEFNDLLATIVHLNKHLNDEHLILQNNARIANKTDRIQRYTIYAMAQGNIEPEPVKEWDPEPALDEPDIEAKILHQQYGDMVDD